MNNISIADAERLPRPKGNLAALTLIAIGIVYGDIGTSPIYTLKTVFSEDHGLALTEANLFGVVSLIVWGLTIVVSLKYVALIMRADNRGEGGIMALMALALASITPQSRWYRALLLVGLFGAALFYGDGVITPAISVLSAVEGLEIATPAFKPYVVPLATAILAVLYLFQRKGTAGIGKCFGPVMLVWFAVIAMMGIVNIADQPAILSALNPGHGLRFLAKDPWLAFIALGAIVLAFTGAEALYADMGHFGKTPIRVSWFLIIFPALALNYLGQGALLLSRPATLTNPFFHQLGPWSVYPLVLLSSLATVIASQSIISGAFSMTHQAISMGVLPRLRIVHTSDKEIGQIYVPLINWLQLIAVIVAVFSFRSSDRLAVAFGLSVSGTMLMTTLLTFFVVRHGWKYPVLLCIASTGFFLLIDALFLSANTLKILDGGWFPLALGLGILLLMLTWNKGRETMQRARVAGAIPLPEFLQALLLHPPLRVAGTAVFFTAPGEGAPRAMLHNLAHNKVLHQRVIFLTVHDAAIPVISSDSRIGITDLGHGFYQLDVRYGFKEERDIPGVLALCGARGLAFDIMKTSFFISRQTIAALPGTGIALWREAVFAAMYRNARDAADYYRIPANRVVELGNKLEI